MAAIKSASRRTGKLSPQPVVQPQGCILICQPHISAYPLCPFRPVMNITLETQPNCRAVLRIEIPAADVQQQRERVTGDYARQARIPGFRPGKAPKHVVAKRFEREIGEEMQNALVRLGYQEAASGYVWSKHPPMLLDEGGSHPQPPP